MKLKLAISILSTLLLLVACSQTEEPSAAQQTASTRTQSTQRITSSPETFTYEINTDELAGGVEVGTLFEVVEVSPSGTGAVEGRRYNLGVAPVALIDSDGETVAYDALVFGVEEPKDTILFNAENAVRGELMIHPVLQTVDALQEAEIYFEVDEHPLFPEVVQKVRSDKRVIKDDYMLTTITKIAVDVTDKYLKDRGLEGLPKKPGAEGNLSPQSVLDSYDWLDTLLSISQDPNDSRKLQVGNRSGLAQRVFVYPKGEVPGDVDALRNQFLKDNLSDFLGSRPNLFGRSTLGIALDLPEDDCKVYEVVTAAFASSFRGDGTPILEDPLVTNLLSLATEVIDVVSPIQQDFTDATPTELEAIEALMRTYFNAQSAENFREALKQENYTTATTEFTNWLLENQEVVQTIFGIDVELEQVVRAMAELFVKDGAGYLKAVEVGGAVVQITAFTSAALNELNGEFSTAIISTGDPKFAMELNDTSLSGTVGEVLTGGFTVKNTGCRAMEYEATVKPSTFPTELGAPGSGTVEPSGEVEQTFQVTCERVGTGNANFHVVGYDAVAGLDHAAANPVVGVECESNIVVDASTTRSSIEFGNAVKLLYSIFNDSTNLGVDWSATEGEVVKIGRTYYYYSPRETPKETPYTVEVTATSIADPSVSKTFDIEIKKIGVDVSSYASSISLGSWTGLKYKVENDVTNSGVTWEASEGRIVKEGSFYTYYGRTDIPRKTPFTIEITATSVADPSVSKSYNLEVAQVELRDVHPSLSRFVLGYRAILFATVHNDFANSGVRWKASGGSIYKYGSNYYFTAEVAGTYTITATSVVDPSVYKKFTITVDPK